MPRSRVDTTLGVVVVHDPPSAASELPAVHGLLGQVTELLVVRNGDDREGSPASSGDEVAGARLISFATNRGTAAAWNAALTYASDRGHRYLYLLDQDSVPGPGAVACALDQIAVEGSAAIVQPAAPGRFGLDPFPWNTVASGALYDVAVIQSLGGFDERLFVDEVDHELHARLIDAGHTVGTLRRATIAHQAGTPRPVRLLGRKAVVSGHSVARRRIQGYSAGVLIRRYARRTPAVSARLVARQALTMAKDLAAGQRASVRTLAKGLITGAATGSPPAEAAHCVCPYCEGPLLGRYAAVPDWRFGTGSPADVYRCLQCGALGAGRIPADDEVAFWYSGYYTHIVEAPAGGAWGRLWPTPQRRREMDRLRWYCTPPAPAGRFLEVGTGSGERLVQFAEAGWDVVGQDIDPEAGHLARQRGIDVHCGPVADLVGRVAPFDLIGLSHVLEHTGDPAGMLQACSALLSPSGRICVISPNAQSLGRILFGRWWFGLEQPRHLAIPTLDSLGQVSRRVGLDTVSAESVATNGAVVLGGSLARPLYDRLPAGAPRGVARSLTALLGQAMGRLAFRVDRTLGEEVVWVGRLPAVSASAPDTRR